MYHRNYTTYLHKELDFLKSMVSHFHDREQVNDLELAIALQKTQEIYEHFLKIKLLPKTVANTVYEKPIKPVATTVVEEEKVTNFEQVVIEQPVVTVPQPKKVTPVKKEDKIQPKPQPQPQPIHQPQPVQVSEEKKKASILAEKISPSESQHINETLAQQKTGSDLSSKLQTAPLTSIASGIGLNDKFLYIRELFKGESDLYNSVIKYLDTAESLEEALEFIQKNFEWNEKNETAQKFVGLLHRRHGLS